MTNRLTLVLLFVWRLQTLEGSEVPDGEKHSFCWTELRERRGDDRFN